jgi:oxygen-dependent protoporphyrinogen oxidase
MDPPTGKTMEPPRVNEVIVVGGGMAGLAAAEALVRAGWGVTVVEATGRPGGVLSTRREDGWLVERSADNVLAARPEAVALIERLGLGPMLVGVAPAVRRALVWHHGRGIPAPVGFRLLAPGSVLGILRTPLLSPAGRLRVLAERFVPPRRPRAGMLDDESLEAFAVRRLGREAFDRLVQPLAAGIWTADPARLGMAAACPDFLAMERVAGSLWAGERARLRGALEPAAAGARYGQFVTLRDGMETLPAALAEHLRGQGARFVTARATALRTGPRGWQVTLESAGEPTAEVAARAVVLGVPAPTAAHLLRPVDASLADELAAIDYAGSAIVSLGFARGDVTHPLDAAGMVVPRDAGRRALAVSFSSSKFPGRAPEGHVLVRVFLGGALDPDVVDLDDAALVALARTEVERLIGARDRPRLERVDRWHGAMPQYHVGHVARVERIMEAVTRHAGLAIAGAAYQGVGIPQVIASGQAAAARISAAGRPHR